MILLQLMVPSFAKLGATPEPRARYSTPIGPSFRGHLVELLALGAVPMACWKLAMVRKKRPRSTGPDEA
jgi:hypothetical protein